MILIYNKIYVNMKHDEVDTWKDAYNILCTPFGELLEEFSFPLSTVY